MATKEQPRIVNCKKCGSEAILQRKESMILIRVKCTKCDNASSYECFSQEAITTWESKNK